MVVTGICGCFVQSKNTGVKPDLEGVHGGGGHTQFWVNDDPEIGQLVAEYDTEQGQSDLIICEPTES